MILADENIDHSIIAAIRNIQIEVLTIYEEARGLTDAEIVALSQNPSRKDFASVVQESLHQLPLGKILYWKFGIDQSIRGICARSQMNRLLSCYLHHLCRQATSEWFCVVSQPIRRIKRHFYNR